MRDGDSFWGFLNAGRRRSAGAARKPQAFRPDAAAAGLEGRQLLSTAHAPVVKHVGDFPTLKLTTYPSPSAFGTSQDLALAPNGDVWFTEPGVGKVAAMTPSGTVAEAPIPSGRMPVGPITAGPDGNIWFTETDRVARVTPAGIVTEFAVGPNARPGGITAGPDGNVWFMDSGTQQVGRVTPDGAVTEFPIPQSAGLKTMSQTNFYHNITAGPGGDVWFTTEAVNVKTGAITGEVGRVTPSGEVTLMTLPPGRTIKKGLFGSSSSTGTLTDAITAGPDGNVWFSVHRKNGASGINRLTPDGQLTQFAIPTMPKGSKNPEAVVAITTGPDHNLWFNLSPSNLRNSPNPDALVGRITTEGRVTLYNLPASTDTQGALLAEGPQSIITGPDGQLWFSSTTRQFSSQTGRVIARFNPLNP